MRSPLLALVLIPGLLAGVVGPGAPALAQSAKPVADVPDNTPPDLAAWLLGSGLLVDHVVDTSINPFYLRADINGDGKLDYVVSLRERNPADPKAPVDTKAYALLAPKSKKKNAVVAPFPHDDTPARDGWYVVDKKTKVSVGVTGDKPPRLKGDAVMIWKAESSSAIVYWTGKKLATYWQGD